MILKQAIFCRCRHCTTCQWRRSLLWKLWCIRLMTNCVSSILPTALCSWHSQSKTARLASLDQLCNTWINHGNGWKTVKNLWLVLRVGYITTEITHPKDPKDKNKKNKRVCPVTGNTHAHPHFHILLMVKPSYFSGKAYIKKARWAELWADCLRVDYLPQVDVRPVKPKNQQKPTWRYAWGDCWNIEVRY